MRIRTEFQMQFTQPCLQNTYNIFIFCFDSQLDYLQCKDVNIVFVACHFYKTHKNVHEIKILFFIVLLRCRPCDQQPDRWRLGGGGGCLVVTMYAIDRASQITGKKHGAFVNGILRWMGTMFGFIVVKFNIGVQRRRPCTFRAQK